MVTWLNRMLCLTATKVTMRVNPAFVRAGLGHWRGLLLWSSYAPHPAPCLLLLGDESTYVCEHHTHSHRTLHPSVDEQSACVCVCVCVCALDCMHILCSIPARRRCRRRGIDCAAPCCSCGSAEQPQGKGQHEVCAQSLLRRLQRQPAYPHRMRR